MPIDELNEYKNFAKEIGFDTSKLIKSEF